MSDLLERLRSHQTSGCHGGCADCYGNVMDDAADAIEALRELNAELLAALTDLLRDADNLEDAAEWDTHREAAHAAIAKATQP